MGKVKTGDTVDSEIWTLPPVFKMLSSHYPSSSSSVKWGNIQGAAVDIWLLCQVPETINVSCLRTWRCFITLLLNFNTPSTNISRLLTWFCTKLYLMWRYLYHRRIIRAADFCVDMEWVGEVTIFLGYKKQWVRNLHELISILDNIYFCVKKSG